MAYFSNGTEGMDYESRYCDRCVHQGKCMVWFVHLHWNYAQLDDTPAGKEVKAILNNLIPRSQDGLDNGECSMFHERTEAEAKSEEEQINRLTGIDKPAPWIQEWLKAKAGAA